MGTYMRKEGKTKKETYWFGLVWFYGISNIVGYFMLNLIFTFFSSYNV